MARRPVGRSGLRDLSERHDEYLYGKKRRRGLNALANVTVSVPGGAEEEDGTLDWCELEPGGQRGLRGDS